MHRSAFEQMGETQARVLSRQNDAVGAEASAWLAEKQADRDEAASILRDAREDETLTIARKALVASERANELAELANSDASKARSIARRANIIATAAAIFATTATIIAAIIGVMYTSAK